MAKRIRLAVFLTIKIADLCVALCFALILPVSDSRAQESESSDALTNSYVQQLGDERTRAQASSKLVEIGPKAIPAVREALETPKTHATAFEILHRIAQTFGPDAGEAVPAFVETLKDDQISLRPDAAAALGDIGARARPAISALTEALQDKEHANVRNAAIRALATIAGKLQDEVESLSDRDLNQAVIDLQAALTVAQATAPAEYAVQIRRPLDFLKLKLAGREKGVLPWMKKVYAQYPWITAAVIFPLAVTLWLLIFLVSPSWLFTLNEKLKAWPEMKMPWLDIKLSVRTLLLLSPFHYHLRVLDAWVADHVENAREWFIRSALDRGQETHLPVHVKMDHSPYYGLTAAELGKEFPGARGRLLIWGEGGIGKTNLAYEVARWAMAKDPSKRLAKHLMLPMILEEELSTQLDSPAASQTRHGELFTAAIRGKLTQLIRASEPPDEQLVKHLLRRGRLLVIVDSFSEMSEDTTRAIKPGDAEFPCNALVITSRNEEHTLLRGESPVKIEPQRLAGASLASFIENLLVDHGAREISKDKDFLKLCSKLPDIVGKREVTVLLAKLYVEHIIALKKGMAKDEPPGNIPELMISYLNNINRRPHHEEHSDEEVHQDTKVIAWECLKETYRSAAVPREAVEKAMGGENPKARLEYLEKKLRLIQEYDYKTEHKLIKFGLDPLAEYLAGLHLIDVFGSDTNSWWDFLARAKSTPGAPESVMDFMQAVEECVKAKGEAAGVPPFVLAALRNGLPWDSNWV